MCQGLDVIHGTCGECHLLLTTTTDYNEALVT